MPVALNAESKKLVGTFLDRFEAFERKMKDRAAEVQAEADGGLDELVAANPFNANALSAGFSAVKSRFFGLRDKVDQALSKLEEEWEEATGDLDLPADQAMAVRQAWAQLVNRSRALQWYLESANERIEAKKNADWARQLMKLAEQECAKPRVCPSCGAPIQASLQHMSESQRCPHCGSVNELAMGEATGLFFGGAGVHSLAQEAAFGLWEKQFAAEHAYHRWRHPSDTDRQRYLDAVTAYWTGYFQEYRKLHPGFGKTVEQAVGERLLHYGTSDNAVDRKARAACSALLKLCAARDARGAKAFLDGKPGIDLDEAIDAAFEHGDRDGTALLLALQHEQNQEDTPRQTWIQERLAELDDELARR